MVAVTMDRVEEDFVGLRRGASESVVTGSSEHEHYLVPLKNKGALGG